MNSAVQNVKFDPIEHLCMAQVNWTPPVFIKGDKRIKFKPVREIMEVCHRVGATAASLTTQARKGGS